MKRLSAALAILLVLLAGSLYSGKVVAQASRDCVQKLRQAQGMADRDDWAQAQAVTQQASRQWEKHEFPLHALLRHSDTDQIQLSFRSVEQYLRLEEMDQYAAANAVLITQLEMIAQMERPAVENVL